MLATNVPIISDLYLEKEEVYYLTIKDQDFDVYDAWCYGFSFFEFMEHTPYDTPTTYNQV